MDIHASAKKRLVETIAAALLRFEVDHARYIRRVPAFIALRDAESVLPANGKLREAINAYVDYDFALGEFIVDSLADELRDQEYLTDAYVHALIRDAAGQTNQPHGRSVRS